MDKETLRQMVMHKMEERTGEIVETLHPLQVKPGPQTMLDAEKGLHAETTRLADAIFAELLQQTIASPELKIQAIEQGKKKPSHT